MDILKVKLLRPKISFGPNTIANFVLSNHATSCACHTTSRYTLLQKWQLRHSMKTADPNIKMIIALDVGGL